MSKPLNHKRRVKALESARVGKARNPVALAVALRGGQGRHKDRRKDAARKACRGKVAY